jgi:membrane-associated phospholipid phosphatase
MGEKPDNAVMRFLRNWSIPLLYLIVLVVTYLRFGFLFQFTLGAVWLLVIPIAVIPIAAYVGKSSREFLKNSVFFVSLLLSYEALQGVTGVLIDSGSVLSLANVDAGMFGLASALQSALASPSLTLVSTFFYGLHVFLIIAAIILFWFTNRMIYRGYAYSMLLTSYLALITFIVFPTSPPWFTGAAQNLLSEGNALLPSALQGLQQALLAIESDKFAAFPSLHAAYAVLFTVYALRLSRKLGLVVLVIACGVFFSTIYLGQHYVIDLLGGIIYSLAAVAVVDKLTATYFRQRLPSVQ